MGMVARRLLFTLAFIHVLCAMSPAATYRVGPGERYAKISEVAARLNAGDVVEVTGDITDSVKLSVSGSRTKPIIIRGTTHVQDGRIIRPHIRPSSPTSPFTVTVSADWIVIEGLGFTGFMGQEYGKAAVVHSARNLVLRNCYFHHNIRSLVAADGVAGDILVEFCEFEADGYGTFGPTTLYSKVPGATAVVQHCYFHSNTGNHLLRMGYPRNVIRYNWFEDQCHFAVQITTPSLFGDKDDTALPDKWLPAHSDILGNVFVSGWGSNTYGALQIGGSSRESPGTEGEFNVAYNLFIGRRGGEASFIPIATHGNVDKINVWNNVFLDCCCGGCKVYERDQTWDDLSRSAAFKRKRGRDDPVVQGANNWISKSATGVPSAFGHSIIGADPGFVSLVDYDFRPAPGSPLAAAALTLTAGGKSVPLEPEYEPHRGIPPDLNPVRRRPVPRPAVGPFEVAARTPSFADDSAALVLGVSERRADVQWQPNFGKARRMALEYLAKGEPDKALQCAKMQFILSPIDPRTIGLAVKSVKQMLTALDGNDARAKVFEEYARRGAAGKDGRLGTDDDLTDPIASVTLDFFARPDDFYERYDRTMDAAAAMGVEGKFYAYWWEQRGFRMNKVFARLEGARFDEALSLALPLLHDAVRMDTAGFSASQQGRHQNLMDRLDEALSVVARGVGCPIPAVENVVGKWRDYARYGLAGADARVGTPDDIDIELGAVAAARPSDARIGVSPAADSGKKRPNLSSVLSVDAPVSGAKTMTLRKLAYIANFAKSGRVAGFVSMWPSPAELYDALLAETNRHKAGLKGLAAAKSAAAESAWSQATERADEDVTAAYIRLLAADRPEAASVARPYVTAYFLGIHDPQSYPAAFALLQRRMADKHSALFLVEDALSPLNDPFLAARVLDAMADLSGTASLDEERNALLETVEERQYLVLKAVNQEARNLLPEEADLRYKWALAGCDAHVSRFPDGRYVSFMRYQKAFILYCLQDYRGAIARAEEFAAAYPDSNFAPNALFVEGVSLIALGDSDAGVKRLISVGDEYPKSVVSPNALFTAGYQAMTSNDYKVARDCFRRVVDFYPHSEYAGKCGELLVKLDAP